MAQEKKTTTKAKAKKAVAKKKVKGTELKERKRSAVVDMTVKEDDGIEYGEPEEMVSLSDIVSGGTDSEEIPSLLDTEESTLDIGIPTYTMPFVDKVKRRWPFSRNGYVDDGIRRVKAIVLDEATNTVEFGALVEYDKVKENNLYPARLRNDWVYPIVVDKDGSWKNYPRQQQVAFKASSFILWLARNWPEHRIIKEEDKSMWAKAIGAGIIAVICLLLIVIFMIMFFVITGD